MKGGTFVNCQRESVAFPLQQMYHTRSLCVEPSTDVSSNSPRTITFSNSVDFVIALVEPPSADSDIYQWLRNQCLTGGATFTRQGTGRRDGPIPGQTRGSTCCTLPDRDTQSEANINTRSAQQYH